MNMSDIAALLAVTHALDVDRECRAIVEGHCLGPVNDLVLETSTSHGVVIGVHAVPAGQFCVGRREVDLGRPIGIETAGRRRPVGEGDDEPVPFGLAADRQGEWQFVRVTLIDADLIAGDDHRPVDRAPSALRVKPAVTEQRSQCLT